MEENLSFTLALAIDRTPPTPIGITRAWRLVFDPLWRGTHLFYRDNCRSPMAHYLLKQTEIEAVKYWSSLVSKSEDNKIRIAIRRILSAINERMNPVDAFVDLLIAWENLFGGRGELSYRISISIAKLLAKDPKERLAKQKEIVKYYDARSKIVHGTTENISELIYTQKRDECLKITLDVMKELYQERNDLLNLKNSDRSKRLALL